MSLARAAHTQKFLALMWPLIFHLVSTRWNRRVWIKFPGIFLAPRENSSRQMSRGSGSERCDLWFPSYPARRISGWKSYTSIPSTTSPSFPSYTLACVLVRPLAHSPKLFFFLSLSMARFSSTWDWIKRRVCPIYTCELLLRARPPSSTFIPAADVLLWWIKKTLPPVPLQNQSISGAILKREFQ